MKGSAVGVRNRRDQQIAAAYGPSVAVKKPKLAAPRPGRVVNAQRAVDDILEKVFFVKFMAFSSHLVQRVVPVVKA